ncbi:MAG: vanadium-dependent haloperoxidase [Acidobacteriota bacterium]
MSRRGFLQGAAGAAGVGAVLGVPAVAPRAAAAASVGPLSSTGREVEALQRRIDAALFQYDKPVVDLPDNGDDDRYASRLASFTKTMPHDALGIVDAAAYDAYLAALASGQGADFDAIPSGGARGLANPRAAFSYGTEGVDSHKVTMPAVHRFDSARQAAEAAELYWKALLRDVSFADYEGDATAQMAATDLTGFSDFTGPKDGGVVTPSLLFRGVAAGDAVGPYISQFLYRGIPYGNRTNRQIAFNPVAGQDFMTTVHDWLAIQNGAAPTAEIVFQDTARFIQNGRDLGEYVHRDYTYQAYLNASLIALAYGADALDPSPYSAALREGGFVTFGPAALWDLVARAAVNGLQVAWVHKWLVHRKLRPEAFGGRVHNMMTGAADYPIHPELFGSPALAETFTRTGTYLLPQAFAEGSPTHPSYPAGHAVIAGACVTVLKAVFNEDFVIPNPVVPTDNGRMLRGYQGDELTLGGEFDKLASNIAIGRNIAGVHWRADGDDGLVAGEAATLALLQDRLRMVVEDDASYQIRRFDGTTVRVTADDIVEL